MIIDMSNSNSTQINHQNYMSFLKDNFHLKLPKDEPKINKNNFTRISFTVILY